MALGLGLFAIALNPLQGNDQLLEMCACLSALGLQMLEVLAELLPFAAASATTVLLLGEMLHEFLRPVLQLFRTVKLSGFSQVFNFLT